MEIKIGSYQIMKALEILSWIIFVGLCIEAGGILFNTFYTLFYNSINTKSFWNGIDLQNLYNFDKGYFFVILSLMGIVSILKCIMFYIIVKVFTYKKLNLSHPFNKHLSQLILNLSIIGFGVGIFCSMAKKHRIHLIKQGVELPDLETLNLEGSGIWFFMSVILFIIVQIVKKGIEIQEEHDLTI